MALRLLCAEFCITDVSRTDGTDGKLGAQKLWQRREAECLSLCSELSIGRPVTPIGVLLIIIRTAVDADSITVAVAIVIIPPEINEVVTPHIRVQILVCSHQPLYKLLQLSNQCRVFLFPHAVYTSGLRCLPMSYTYLYVSQGRYIIPAYEAEAVRLSRTCED